MGAAIRPRRRLMPQPVRAVDEAARVGRSCIIIHALRQTVLTIPRVGPRADVGSSARRVGGRVAVGINQPRVSCFSTQESEGRRTTPAATGLKFAGHDVCSS